PGKTQSWPSPSAQLRLTPTIAPARIEPVKQNQRPLPVFFLPPSLCRCPPPRRGLDPPHKTFLLCPSAELGPRGAPRTHGDNLQTALSVTSNLHPRHTPAAAVQCGSGSRRTVCAAPPPPPAGR